ncbi:hypothetical protein BHF72_0145 [Cloacibacterium normanense]|uniref:Uncharacterized protein n=1 Tax=Cloacibacterium normanense TaxID=237258 RepID=A0A1E5UD09_9FLAO|nr:hypothetical protein BHF72_0145 [Cloacibacterium normanense]
MIKNFFKIKNIFYIKSKTSSIHSSIFNQINIFAENQNK